MITSNELFFDGLTNFENNYLSPISEMQWLDLFKNSYTKQFHYFVRQKKLINFEFSTTLEDHVGCLEQLYSR